MLNAAWLPARAAQRSIEAASDLRAAMSLPSSMKFSRGLRHPAPAVDWWGGKQIEGLRLVNGTAPTNGRLEVTVNGTAGSVCNYGSAQVAGVACRQLGLGTTGALFNDTLLYDPLPAWIRNITCLGNNARLQDCLIERAAGDSCGGAITIACSSGTCEGGCATHTNQLHMNASKLLAASQTGVGPVQPWLSTLSIPVSLAFRYHLAWPFLGGAGQLFGSACMCPRSQQGL